MIIIIKIIRSKRDQILFNWVNPLRAGLVERPEDYRWNSLGYHIQRGNKDDFLSLDFGPVKYASLSLRELHRARLIEFELIDAQERLKRYRRYVYDAGALNRPEKRQAKVINNDPLKIERMKNYEIIDDTEWVSGLLRLYAALFRMA